MLRATLSRAEKYSVALLSVVAFALRIPLALRPERMLTYLPYMDDGYYLFSIARNLAQGRPPSIDGVHLTNGFQPLILALYVPIFWLCGTDGWLAVRWTFILSGAIATLTVWAVALALRAMEHKPQQHGLTAPIIAAAIWAGSYQILGHITNGLETGLFSLFLLLSIICYANIQSDEKSGVKVPLRNWFLFGVVLGFTVLARVDAAILVAIVVAMLAWKRKMIPAFAVGGIALLISAPWWVYNWVWFGNLMPSSGQAENSWPLPPYENIAMSIKAISEIASLLFYLPGAWGWTIRGTWTASLIAALGFAFFRTPLRERLRGFRMMTLLPFFLFSLVLVVYYTFFFRAPHYLSRYFQPGRILWTIVAAAGAASFLQIKPRLARPVMLLIATMGILFSAYQYAAVYYPSFYAYEFYDSGLWANRHPNEKIGMLQSGIASFMAPNIINLDGKVNTDALRAHQEGRLAEYLRDEHFTYIVDLKPFIEDIAAIAKKNELYFDSVGMIEDKILLMKRRTDGTP